MSELITKENTPVHLNFEDLGGAHKPHVDHVNYHTHL